jgi:hypothetical protein
MSYDGKTIALLDPHVGPAFVSYGIWNGSNYDLTKITISSYFLNFPYAIGLSPDLSNIIISTYYSNASSYYSCLVFCKWNGSTYVQQPQIMNVPYLNSIVFGSDSNTVFLGGYQVGFTNPQSNTFNVNSVATPILGYMTYNSATQSYNTPQLFSSEVTDTLKNAQGYNSILYLCALGGIAGYFNSALYLVAGTNIYKISVTNVANNLVYSLPGALGGLGGGGGGGGGGLGSGFTYFTISISVSNPNARINTKTDTSFKIGTLITIL